MNGCLQTKESVLSVVQTGPINEATLGCKPYILLPTKNPRCIISNHRHCKVLLNIKISRNKIKSCFRSVIFVTTGIYQFFCYIWIWLHVRFDHPDEGLLTRKKLVKIIYLLEFCLFRTELRPNSHCSSDVEEVTIDPPQPMETGPRQTRT